MVRVGGGWVALDEFLLKNDPCRGKCFFHLICLFFFFSTSLPPNYAVGIDEYGLFPGLILNGFLYYNNESLQTFLRPFRFAPTNLWT